MNHREILQRITRNVFFVFILIGVTSFQGQVENPNDGTTLKVISYNIWNGFEWGEDESRNEELIKWIKSEHPDVVALQELCGYTEEKLLNDAKKWGHAYAKILKTSGYPVGISSNKPIEVKERILDSMHHGALHCKISGIDFMVVHFSPFSYEKRQEEAKIVLEKLSQIASSQDKYIVLGDFNALSPFDADLYRNNASLLKSMRESEVEHSHVRNLFLGQLEYGVMASYLAFPLIDVTQKFTWELDQRISCPTQVFEKEKGEGRNTNSKRIDYILTSPFLSGKCIVAKVLNQTETFYLSDHYPVLAEFEL